MDRMSFKDFIWPNNPESLTIEHRRDPQFGEDEVGRPIYLGMSQPKCVVTGSGELTGQLVYDTIWELEELFSDSASGLLTLPHEITIHAYFTELQIDQDPRQQYARYHFTFQQTDDAGGIPA